MPPCSTTLCRRISPTGSRTRPRAGGRRHPAQVRALRVLQRDLSDLPAPRRRAGRAARAHLPDQAGARRRRGHREDAAPPRSLPHLPQLRDHVSVGRAVRPPGRHRPQARRGEGRPAGRGAGDAARRCQRVPLQRRVRAGGKAGAARAAAAAVRTPATSYRRRRRARASGPQRGMRGRWSRSRAASSPR